MPRTAEQLPPPRIREQKPEVLPEDIEAYEASAESPELILANIKHERETAQKGQNILQEILRKREESEGDESAHRQLRVLERLETGRIVKLDRSIAEPGKNETVAQCLIESQKGDDPPLLAISKGSNGSPEFFVGSSGQLYKVRMRISGKRVSRTLEPCNARACGTPLQDIIQNTQDTKYQQLLAESYGVDPRNLPLTQNPFFLNWLDRTHESRSAIATSWLATLMRLPVCAETVFREQDGQPITLQRAVIGDYLTDGLITEVSRFDANTPFAVSCARIAALHFGAKEGDGTAYNILGDAGGMNAIDSGGAFLHSVRTDAPESAHPAEQFATTYRSVAWQLAQQYGWTLPEQDRAHLQSVVADFATYVTHAKSGSLGQNDQSAVQTVNALKSIVMLAYERVDEEESLIPDTRAVAMHELRSLIARLDYLAEHGRPPVFHSRYHKRTLKLPPASAD